MVNEFPFGTSQSGKRDYLSEFPFVPGISSGTNQKKYGPRPASTSKGNVASELCQTLCCVQYHAITIGLCNSTLVNFKLDISKIAIATAAEN